MSPHSISLRDLLTGYDREVEQTLQEVLESSTGTERVQLLHKLRHSVSVHDSVLGAALCPLLDDLPGGRAVAERLRQGCNERTDLMSRFRELINGVAAHNVYPVSGEEIEQILEGLSRSFRRHEKEETTAVAGVLEAASASTDPEVVAARMVLEAHRAPTRSHEGTIQHPRAVVRQKLYHYMDKFRDWSDTHHGWTR